MGTGSRVGGGPGVAVRHRLGTRGVTMDGVSEDAAGKDVRDGGDCLRPVLDSKPRILGRHGGRSRYFVVDNGEWLVSETLCRVTTSGLRGPCQGRSRGKTSSPLPPYLPPLVIVHHCGSTPGPTRRT